MINIASLYRYNREKSNESHRKKSNIIYNTYMPISYTLIRSKRKSLALQIDPSGKLIIRSPLRMDIAHIERFIMDKIEWITKHQKRIQSLPKQAPRWEDDIKVLKEKIKNYITPKVYAYWENKNLPKITSIKITKSEKRWWSCSSKNWLCFSYKLGEYIEKNPWFIDAIIIHELAHLREKNHQKPFWDLVYSWMPDYDILIKSR